MVVFVLRRDPLKNTVVSDVQKMFSVARRSVGFNFFIEPRSVALLSVGWSVAKIPNIETVEHCLSEHLEDLDLRTIDTSLKTLWFK
jgi:hypothetical protein